MDGQKDQQPLAATDAGHHPDQRGSAATVLAHPQTDASMTTANPGGAGSTGTGAEPKRQKKSEANLQGLDLTPLPEGFKAAITSPDDNLNLTQSVRALEALLMKHHQAVALY